ncbi:hypothetical protein B0H14DRAFT_3503735 [Mycena olivaceomarginata]|nr:hypothetical protein B0H14DRAFT_3503735 [Mycena olivaceomarginata]
MVDLREEEEESSSGSELENNGAELNDNNEVQPELLEEEARSQEGNAAIDSIVVTDEIAEWVETVLDDAAPLHPLELASLAADGLIKARKLQDFRTTILFAALTGFCHWKGVYWDGHERKDVKKHRKEYLAELDAADPFRPQYAEPDMAEIRRDAEDDSPEHIFIVHDESTPLSNEYQNNHYWLQANEQVLKKKGCRRLIMISAFLCEHFGLLDLTNEMVAENEALVAELRLAFTKSTTVVYPDNKPGGEAYWNMEQMVVQMAKAILIARCMFLKAMIRWVFDNSSVHGILAKNALTVTKMNVNPGGKVPEMHNTVIPLDNPWGDFGGTNRYNVI